MVISLHEMFLGESGEIVSLGANTPDVKRLRSMGIQEGKVVDLLYCDQIITKKVVVGAGHSRIAFPVILSDGIRVRPLKNYFETVREMAHHDKLTGCFNRHVAEHLLREEVEKFSERKVPLALLLADIDHFKQINDTLGHDGGDAVLKRFAALVQSGLRRSDVLFRWGGEEFLILLRGTVQEEAREIAERIRALVESCVFSPFSARGQVTVSIGGCGLPPGRPASRLISDADTALYKAKNAGRNRVLICS